MHDRPSCQVCAAPTGITRLCQAHRQRLWEMLAMVPALLDDLQVELMNASRKTQPHGRIRASSTRPLPVNLAASERLDDVRRLVGSGLRLLRPYQRPAAAAGTKARAAALVRHIDELVLCDAVGDFYHACEQTLRRAWRLCDLPAERVHLGTCACGASLTTYREPTDPNTHTRAERYHLCDCGLSYPVEATVEALARDADRDREHHRLTPAQIEQATDRRIRADRVRQWVCRERLTPDAAGRVRFGDVLDLELAAIQRAAEAAQKRAEAAARKAERELVAA